MDESLTDLDKFESILKQGSTTATFNLYKPKTNLDFNKAKYNQTLDPQSIINSVDKQIRALQKSESVKSERKSTICMDKYKKSTFLPLKILQEETMPPDPNKFETQNFSNTQLINIVQDVEALVADTGMTQEFETTFCHDIVADEGSPENANNITQKDEIFPVIDISLKDPDPTKLLQVEHYEQNTQFHENAEILRAKNIESDVEMDIDKTEIFNECIEIKDIDVKGTDIHYVTDAENVAAHYTENHLDTDEHNTDILNECIEIKDTYTQEALVQDAQTNLDEIDDPNSLDDIVIPSSPILNIKVTKSKSHSSSPLVFNLDTFENFEKIASPVVELTTDKEQAKFFINSQVICNELLLQTDVEKSTSPIIGLCNDVLKIDKDEQILPKLLKDVSKTDETANLKEGEVFEDEILFSSDEEDGYEHRSYKDLPFTCALETSFYNNSEVLDKTMYVGFQTASSKSIQIETDSFIKAKSFLDSIEQDLQNEATLTELVRLCESSTVKSEVVDTESEISMFNDNGCIQKHQSIADSKEQNKDTDSKTENSVEPYEKQIKNNKTNKANQFVVFKTASNKDIQVSEKALAISKKLFDDIDLNENIQLNKETKNNAESYNPKNTVNDILEKTESTETLNKEIIEQNLDDEIIKEFQNDLNNTELEDIFNDIDQVKDSPMEEDMEKNKQELNVIGFRTASNKNINISDAALAKSKKLFSDIELLEEDNNVKEVTSVQESGLKLRNMGFKTANNKQIPVLKRAIAIMKNVFYDIDLHNYPNNKPTTSKDIIMNVPGKHENDKEMKEKQNKETFVGFKTASNKRICISAEALAKGRNILEREAEDIEPPFYGFDETDIELVEETLKRSQRIFDKVKDTEQNEKELLSEEKFTDKAHDVDKMRQKITSFTGFRTASNKEVHISEESLAKSKRIFQDIEENTSDIKPESNKTKFQGFQTASNKRIKISKEALIKSRKLFQDIDNDRKTDAETTKNKELELFFPKAIEIDGKLSEHAVQKRENIFSDIDTSNKIKNTVCEETRFKGFQTPSINPLKKQCSANRKTILQDVIDIKDSSKSESRADSSGESANMCTKYTGFQTASNKEVKISEKALAKSIKLFQDIDDTAGIGKCNEFKQDAFGVDPVPKFTGFQTASNKAINISEEALTKSRKVFEDIDLVKTAAVPTDNVNESARKINIVTVFKGFQTASNKEVKISEEALAKSRKLFQDIDDIQTTAVCTENVNKSTRKINTLTAFKGFQTASNKEVKISEEALAKSRILFQDIDDIQTTAVFTENVNESARKIHNLTAFKGFQTASNKQVKISAKVLAKSRKLFQDIDDVRNIEDQTENQHKITPKLNTSGAFKGFQTASNKIVKISEEALAKSRQLFQNIDSIECTNEDTPKIGTTATFKGFQTASNRPVKISDEALAKSKELFREINNLEGTSEDIPKIDTTATFKGFHTASNKKVKISDEALAKSRQLFQNIDNIENSNERSSEIYMTANFKGFQTASNKEVKISEESLAKSKQLFHDINNEKTVNIPEDFNPQNIKSKFIGFQTANNEEVRISEEAIAKSRKLFQDLKLDPCENPSIQREENTRTKNAIGLIKDITKDVPRQNILEREKQHSKDIESKVNSKHKEFIDDIDTQLMNNFEEPMHEVTPNRSKRSGSPILSCPKAKRRKIFQIPYSQKSSKKSTHSVIKPADVQKPENVYNFRTFYKKTKEYNLRDVKIIEESSNHESKVDADIQKLSYKDLDKFIFCDQRNDLTDTPLSLTDLKTMFLNSVNRNLVPEGWLDIHLKLILWKLISYEMKFPKTMNLTCTAKNVIEQLKYRYDKELYNAERPALRKIFERDDTSTKTIVLCVVEVYEGINESPPELLLTDGWYVIRAVIDKMLARYVGSGKITVGTKLVTHGAELVGSEQAVSPWEDTTSTRLKIFGNSTRRARWDARLGYHGNAAILSRLSKVACDGGKVSKLRVFVARVYPALYVDKFEDGSTVTRSERLEHLHQMKYESERQALLEKIYEEVEKEVLDQDSQDSEGVMESGIKRKCLDSGSQIAKLMKTSKDPAEFKSNLTSTQTALLDAHTSKERERLIQEIQTRVQDKMVASGLNVTRNVVTLLKVRVAGVEEKQNGVDVCKALLSIWRPNDAVTEIIKEGTWIDIMNVMPTAIRYSELQISAGRQSVFSHSKYKENEKIIPYTASLKRICYPLKDLVKNPAMTTDYNEIDTVGIIFEIDPPKSIFDPKKYQFQNVYLTDDEKNIISVNFWGGLKKFGFENVLDTGQIVSCTNLQKRAGNTRKNIPQYRVTEFSYFTKTPKSETARKVIEELSQKFIKIDKKTYLESCISLKNNYSSKPQSNENITPYRLPNVDLNSSKARIFLDTPLAQKRNDDNLNLTGLDFDSTFIQTDTQDLSPKTLLRKRQVKEKIAKLQKYGEPPPLSPIQIINKSKNAANAFKSPLLSKTDVSPGVANSKISNQTAVFSSVASVKNHSDIDSKSAADADIQCSPVICFNKTYVKRSKPVKLNFSKNESSINEAVDEFAEEFDCSPPLSLD